MGVFECERLAQQYADWLRDEIKVEAVGDICVVTAPFVDYHRDFLQVYVTRTDTGLLLSDDGYVIRNLRISGAELETERRHEALNQILGTFGVTLREDELQIATSGEGVAQAKHDLIQTMLAVGDLIHLAQPTVVAIFKEDVDRYLRAKGISFVGDVRLAGSSGFDHSFDFVVGATRERPERYIRAISTPNRENVVELMFSWQDLRDVRPANALAYAVLNDQERQLARPLLDALDKYGIGVIPWSDRDTQVGAFRG